MNRVVDLMMWNKQNGNSFRLEGEVVVGMPLRLTLSKYLSASPHSIRVL